MTVRRVLEVEVQPRLNGGGLSRRDVIAATLLLVPAFFLRIFIGTDASNYAEYPGVTLTWLGYLCHIALIGYALAAGALRPTLGQIALLAAIAVLSVVQVVNLHINDVVTAGEALVPLVRGLMWVGAIWSFLALSSSTNALVEVFVRLAKFTAVVILACLLFYLASGIAFGVYIAGGIPRSHGFLTEPSGVAYVIPTFGALMLYRREWKWLLFSGGAAVASLSVLTVATWMIVVVLGALLRLGLVRAVAVFLITMTVMAAAIPAVISTTTGRQIVASLSDSASQRMADGNVGEDGGNLLEDYIVSRVYTAVSELDRLLDSASSDDEVGPLARLFGMIKVFDELDRINATWFGHGINVYGYIQTRESVDALLDFGYPSFMFSSLGILFGSLATGLSVVTTLYFLTARPPVGVLLMGFVVATLWNSAAGIHSYAIPMMAALVPFAGRHLMAVRVGAPRHSQLRLSEAVR